MTRKQLKKLSRLDLLEMLLEQSKELEQVKLELEETKKQLEDKNLKLNNVGSIAEATVALSDIFKEAQKVADDYIENVKKQTCSHCNKNWSDDYNVDYDYDFDYDKDYKR